MQIYPLKFKFVSKSFYLHLLLLVEIYGKSVKISQDENGSSEKKKSEEGINDDFGKVRSFCIFYDSVCCKNIIRSSVSK